jgi:hypothetical protein
LAAGPSLMSGAGPGATMPLTNNRCFESLILHHQQHGIASE